MKLSKKHLLLISLITISCESQNRTDTDSSHKIHTIDELISIAGDLELTKKSINHISKKEISEWKKTISKDPIQYLNKAQNRPNICLIVSNLHSQNLIEESIHKKTQNKCHEIAKTDEKIEEIEKENSKIKQKITALQSEIQSIKNSITIVVDEINSFEEKNVKLSGIIVKEFDPQQYEISVLGETGVLIGDIYTPRIPIRFNFWVRPLGRDKFTMKNGRHIYLPVFRTADESNYHNNKALLQGLIMDLNHAESIARSNIELKSNTSFKQHRDTLINQVYEIIANEAKPPTTAPPTTISHTTKTKTNPLNEPQKSTPTPQPENNLSDSTKLLINSDKNSPFYWRLYERRIESMRFLQKTKQLKETVALTLKTHPEKSIWLLSNLAHGCEDASDNICAREAHQLLAQYNPTHEQIIDSATFWLATSPPDIEKAKELISKLPDPIPKSLRTSYALLQSDIHWQSGRPDDASQLLDSLPPDIGAVNDYRSRMRAGLASLTRPRTTPPRPFRAPRSWASAIPDGPWSDEELAIGLLFEAISHARKKDFHLTNLLIDDAIILAQKPDTIIEISLFKGKVYELEGKDDIALSHYRNLNISKPNDSKIMGRLAWFLVTTQIPNLRNPHEALPLAEQAVALTARQDPSILDTLAEIYAQLSKFEDALAIIDECQMLEPSRKYYEKRTKDFKNKTSEHIRSVK